MPSFSSQAQANDNSIFSDDAVYATAAAGSNLSLHGDCMNGQRKPGNYNILQAFIIFDLTSVPTGVTITDPIINFYCNNKPVSNADADVLQVRRFDWTPALTTASWRTTAQFAALPLCAHYLMSSMVDDVRFDCVDDAMAANLTPGALNGFVITGANFASATPSTVNGTNTFRDQASYGGINGALLTFDYTPSSGLMLASD